MLSVFSWMVSKTFEMPIFEDCCPTIVESQSGTCAIKAAFALAFATSSARGSGGVSSFVSVAYANTVLVFATKKFDRDQCVPLTFTQ